MAAVRSLPETVLPHSRWDLRFTHPCNGELSWTPFVGQFFADF